uniref:Uncharacterized protein LOC111115717 isoform X2 n=1 Tax=Crassostrea virginica TaxID=6565 RepID=A0A8B8C578_CRAVI|nr:uncharacterized protein LOC111115717 isoform X2 [Crassostrea virginica]
MKVLYLYLHFVALVSEARDLKINKTVGDSVEILWTAPFFPQAGDYNIYHTNEKNNSKSIIQVTSDNVTTRVDKYEYLSQPFNSTDIMFMIRDITLDDAGYFAGGIKEEDARSGGGVVLIVFGKPLTPNITGSLNISVGNISQLFCLSKPTSAPNYYAQLVNLSYTWFVNGTKLDKEMGQSLELNVTKDHKYNNYTCTAMDHQLESDHSNPVQINPLYKPDKVLINPMPKVENGKLTVKEWETIGPYYCSADCNPPCEIKWRYKDTAGKINDVSPHSKEALSPQIATSNITDVRCVAKYNENDRERYIIHLNIQYLDKPLVYINGEQVQGHDSAFQVSEAKIVYLSCYVNSNPVPQIKLTKGVAVTISEDKNNDWLNHTIESSQCSDTGTYKCMGLSTGFNNTENTFGLSVTCNTRIDNSTPIKTLYGSMSGNDVNVHVALPVMGNPPPQESMIMWFGPVKNVNITSTVSQQDVPYKHWINSSIPIINQNYYGNYTLNYNGTDIISVIIITEDVPRPPMNFTGYAYGNGYVNLTWVSGFNGGPEQYFLLYTRLGSNLTQVRNISDPGEGKLVNFDHGPLNMDGEYCYVLKSCNRINCSAQTVEAKVTIHSQTTTALDEMSVATAILAVVITVCFTRYFLKRKKRQRRREIAQVEPTEGNEPDIVMYAVVDKTKKFNAGVISDISPASKEDEHDINQEEGPSVDAGQFASSSSIVNPNGLVYVQVDFSNKTDDKDTNRRPQIHGEENRTEYTFVDFYKKAPPIQKDDEDQ